MEGHLVFGAAEVGSACEITTRIRTPAAGAGEPINYVYLYIYIQQVFFDVLDVLYKNCTSEFSESLCTLLTS